MTTSYAKMPISLINQYLWDLANGNVDGQDAIDSSVWDTSVYTYRPFFPVSENLAIDTEKTPFIIYDFLFSQPNGTMWFVDKEQATYTIVGELPQLFYVKTFIYDALKKFDQSAQELNNHIQDPDISFKWIKCEQSNFMIDEKRIDSFKPKFVTCLTLTYEYTKK